MVAALAAVLEVRATNEVPWLPGRLPSKGYVWLRSAVVRPMSALLLLNDWFGENRTSASRPEAVSQAFSGSGTRLFSSEERRFFKALRYLLSS